MAKKNRKKKGAAKPPPIPIKYEDTREIESLMRHDGYRRAPGGIRQIRRGS